MRLQEEESDTTRKEEHDKRTYPTQTGGEMGQDGERRKIYSAAVIDGFKRNSTIFLWENIVRKTDTRLSKGEDVVVCLPGARIEHVTESVDQIMGRGNGGAILVHIGTNNATVVGQILLSGIIPVFGNRIQGYRNSKTMTVKWMVEQLFKEEEVGYMDLWDSFVGKRKCTRETACILVVWGLPFLPGYCQGRLPVAWVNVGRGVCQSNFKTYKRIADVREYRGKHHNLELNVCAC